MLRSCFRYNRNCMIWLTFLLSNSIYCLLHAFQPITTPKYNDYNINVIIHPRHHHQHFIRRVESPSEWKLASHKTLSTIAETTEVLSPLERWCVDVLETRYEQALSIKCPFFRRRAADLLDATDMILRFLVIRHKTLLPPPPGWRLANDEKQTGLSYNEIYEILKQDWRTDSNKGYYITGRLTSSIFRDDCLFDGPDPDMPVRGLRKYLNAASQLFDHKRSYAELLSLNIVQDDAKDSSCSNTKKKIVATWKMSGILRLPWKPSMPEIHGTTTYYTDEFGLVYKHIETWEESVFQAFVQTFFPALSEKIKWKQIQQKTTVQGGNP